MPHALSNDGIFDNNSISEWLQKDRFTNPELLAIEIPKLIHKMSSGFQKLLRSGEDCDPGWKRIRPIATLMSSDNKMLDSDDAHHKPKSNSIGYRYSWIKMSAPSIESLRQAFLDHESRIVLPEDVSEEIHPEQRNRHAYIKSISINNAAFLANQEVHFSPNMNCIIGGRGSGKSTLLEYLRIILGKESQKELDAETQERIARAKSTLTPQTTVKICWVTAEGAEDTIVWQNNECTVQGRELIDSETFFRGCRLNFIASISLII